MIKTQKVPLIHSILPYPQDYLEQVQDFYHDKIQTLMNKITQFIAIAIELTQIPQHLSLEFTTIKTMPKLTQQERQIEYAMLKQEIQKFLSLKNEVVQSQTGTKYLYPELPKIQRNLQKRKNSKSDSTSSDSDKNDTSQRKESVNQICDLLGTLTLQNKSDQEICNSIENIVDEMGKLNLNTSSTGDQIQTQRQFSKLKIQNSVTRNSVELYEIRKKKKSELLKFQSHFHQNQDQMGSLNFQQTFKQKLLHIKQLFKTHLQNSVQKVTKEIQSILSKALKDIKQNQKVYVPIHKISKNFNQLNLKFYRTEGVIKCLHKYLMKKIKQCIMDSHHTYVINGKDTQIKTNFRLRFFKHILLENIFFSWLEHAITDLNRIIRQDGHLEMIKCQQSHKQSFQNSPQKDNTQKNEHSIDESTSFFPLHKGSFDNFIM